MTWTMLEGVPIEISPWLREDDVHVIEGKVYAGSMSAVLAQARRELRRMDAVAAFTDDSMKAGE